MNKLVDSNTSPEARCSLFRALHAPRDGGRLLLLPNAWDALSARLTEAAGAEAVATSSAAIAWARGYPDGERLPLEEVIRSTRDLARVVRVPLTVDLERGYGADPDRVADAVAGVVEAGAVGVNLEDGAESADVLARKIRAVRRRLGDSVFINARTCVILHGKVAVESAAREVLTRAQIFADAGADGLFVPRLADPRAIEAIARGTSLPLNLMLIPQLAPLAELARLGVRRLSVGPHLAEVAYGAARRAARDLLGEGAYGALVAGDLPYPEANALFSAAEPADAT